MKNFSFALVLSLLFVSPVQADQPLPEVEIVKSKYQRWQFRNVRTNRTDKGLVLTGRLNARIYHGLPRGHVDIAAWSPDGALIMETTSSYSPGTLSKRLSRRGGVQFTTDLPELPANTKIMVAFHRDGEQQTQKPVHEKTVAR
uniref:Uncharacterized protein n=1 Tax=Magnetococcus massalia (strain MO-1) TaxID=451514 RepID=A0A1S7LJ21_MAGMO|nr:Conserved exported protein of unknown function [Candidatus Magnetococcus massalia]